MYGKSKIKQTKPVISANDSIIRLLTINNHRFVVGLEWETIKAQRKLMQQVKRIGKSRNLDVVAIRKAEAIQAGFAPKTRQKLRGAYSLIVSLASLLDGICIAVVKVGVAANDEAEYTLLGRTEKGAIHPLSDVVYPESKIKQVVLDLKQDLRGKQQDSEIKVYGEQDKFEWVTDPLDLNELLIPANISKEFRLKPLRWGMTKGQLTGFTVALLMSGVAVFFINNYLNEQDLRKRQAIAAMLQQQEEINKKARYQAALNNLKHPWITSPSIPIFLQGCENGLKKLQLSIKGWVPGSIKCTKEGIAVNYNRPDNSAVTTKEFVEAVKSIYGTSPDFNITETSMSAFFYLMTYRLMVMIHFKIWASNYLRLYRYFNR